MKYKKGETVRIGDRVRLSDGTEGVVVFCVDNKEYSAAYPEAEWGYLSEGVMIKFEKIGLVHYSSSDDELELIFRG